MEFIKIEIQQRTERGTAAVQRLRREGSVPAVLYGLSRQNLSLTIPGPELERFLRTGSHLVELTMETESRDAIVREVQHDPITDVILHVDFQRVDKNASIEDQVRLTYKGVPPGSKEGGVFQGLMDHLRVQARPRDLPEEIIVDITGLHVGDAIHVRDIQVPESVTVIDAPDELAAHVVIPRGRGADEGEEEGAGDALAEGGEGATAEEAAAPDEG